MPRLLSSRPRTAQTRSPKQQPAPSSPADPYAAIADALAPRFPAAAAILRGPGSPEQRRDRALKEPKLAAHLEQVAIASIASVYHTHGRRHARAR